MSCVLLHRPLSPHVRLRAEGCPKQPVLGQFFVTRYRDLFGDQGVGWGGGGPGRDADAFTALLLDSALPRAQVVVALRLRALMFSPPPRRQSLYTITAVTFATRMWTTHGSTCSTLALPSSYVANGRLYASRLATLLTGPSLSPPSPRIQTSQQRVYGRPQEWVPNIDKLEFSFHTLNVNGLPQPRVVEVPRFKIRTLPALPLIAGIPIFHTLKPKAKLSDLLSIFRTVYHSMRDTHMAPLLVVRWLVSVDQEQLPRYHPLHL